MVGGEHGAPRVAAEQEQLEPDAPLQGVHVVARLVGERHDPAAGLGLGVGVDPLAVRDVAQHGGDRRVGGHRGARPEHHLPDVAAVLGVAVEVLGQVRRARTQAPAELPAVGVELQVREVRAAPGERVQRVARRAPVAGHPEVVAVHVHGVGQRELVDRARDRLDHLARRHARDVVVERGDVAVVALEHLDPAGVDELHAVAGGGAQPPGDRVAHPAGLAPDQVEEREVVAHEHEEGGVDHRRVAQLGERVAGGQRRGRGVDHGRVAEQRVAVAGRERGRDGAARAGAGERRALEHVLAVLLRRELAGRVDLRPGDVGVDVDAARHHHHAAGVDAPGVRRDVGDDLAVL